MESVQSRLMDRISNLPDNITQTILNKLPTRDAVRTSILSRKWRHAKDKLSQFVIDETLLKKVAKDKGSSKTTLGRVLYQLLLGHDGPINKFKLSYNRFAKSKEVDNLISFLCKRHIQHFSLAMYEFEADEVEGYLLPSSILSCPTLRHLKLKYCSIRSFASVGLSMLTTLKLLYVSISDETLASLISGSPLLTILKIDTHDEFHICIDAPNLTTLTIIGRFTHGSIKFERVPVLASVSIDMEDDTDSYKVVYGDTNTGFFDCLFALETLRLSNVVQGIALGIPKKLPTTLVNLKEFILSSICLSVMVQLQFTLCLLKSSPNIEYIEMLLEDQPVDDDEEESMVAYMEGEDFSNMRWSELSEVRLLDLTGTVMELEFIRLLLANLSSLKEIQIQPKRSVAADKGFEILKEISTFPRKSNEAQVIFDNHNNNW